MAGVYWHQVCSYGQPVGSKELLEAAVASDIRLTAVLFFRSVEGTKAACKTSAGALGQRPGKCRRTCPLDFRVMVPPRKKNEETEEYNDQAGEQQRTISDPERRRSAYGRALRRTQPCKNEATSSRRLSRPGKLKWIQIQCSR